MSMCMKHLFSLLTATIYLVGILRRDGVTGFKLADTNTLKTVLMIHRHGDRNPVTLGSLNPNKANNFPDGLGRVTLFGKQRLYGLGMLTRLRYANFLTFDPNEAYVHSSNMDRCLVSAQMVSSSIYPPRTKQLWSNDIRWQPVPVHSLPEHYDPLTEAGNTCPRLNVERRKLEQTPEVQAIRRRMAPISSLAERDLGLEFGDWWKLGWLYADLGAQEKSVCPTCTLPSWYNSTIRNTLREVTLECFKLNTYTPLLRQLYAGPMLQELVHRIHQPLVNDSEGISFKRKLFVYSSHDSEMTALMNAVDIHYLEPPGFASSMFFEFHQIPRSAEPIVRLYYTPDGGPEKFCELTMGCHETNESFCNLTAFEKLVQQINPYDYVRECFSPT
ncbi:putative acid phosphatase 5 [Fragariocoptes setiger]|uniref:Acid phosphatase 5 n=1 Tax=Fragariocoptes setiger TaxID=1670756 RepID=A0ABQ7S7B2_9ACAR|nr:putative acid phosphatase 5 [Fragariocoptes setiger]